MSWPRTGTVAAKVEKKVCDRRTDEGCSVRNKVPEDLERWAWEERTASWGCSGGDCLVRGVSEVPVDFLLSSHPSDH